MEGIKIEVTGNVARVTDKPAKITAGTVGLPVEFTFDADWDGLSKTAVFLAGHECKIVERLDTEAIVPWELLEKPGAWLHIGVYGTNDDGTVAIPTTFAKVSAITPSAHPDGDPATDPTLPVYQELIGNIGDPVELRTNNKDNLVEAINEVHSIAKSGGIETDPTLSEEGLAADAAAVGEALDNLEIPQVYDWALSNTKPKYTASEVGAVPTTRTVNGKSLSTNITLNANDVQARPYDWMPEAGDIGAVPTYRKINNKPLSTDIHLTASDVDARPGNWMPHKSDIDLGNVANERQYSANNPPPYPVTSVNGKTGVVSLSATEVGARPNTWIPTVTDIGLNDYIVGVETWSANPMLYKSGDKTYSYGFTYIARKWNSGLIEIYGTSSDFECSITKAWGNLFESGAFTLPNYNEALKSVMYCQVSFAATPSSATVAWTEGALSNSLTSPGSTYLCRADSVQSAKGRLCVNTVGTWK